MAERCVGNVYDSRSFRGSQCRKDGVLEHDGKWWCKAHHPPTVREKYERAQAAWKAKEAARIAAARKAKLGDAALTWLRENRPDVAEEMEKRIS